MNEMLPMWSYIYIDRLCRHHLRYDWTLLYVFFLVLVLFYSKISTSFILVLTHCHICLVWCWLCTTLNLYIYSSVHHRIQHFNEDHEIPHGSFVLHFCNYVIVFNVFDDQNDTKIANDFNGQHMLLILFRQYYI